MVLFFKVNIFYTILEIVSIVVSIRVDRLYDKKVVWDRELKERDSETYQLLAHEANRAVSNLNS